jgi:hypothetical protein
MNIGEMKPGVRLHSIKDDWSDLIEGSYCKLPNGDWAIYSPGGTFGTISPTVHTIVEHEDGTITVSPSILFKHGRKKTEGWHGYLEKGIWRRV